jgi:hypothetical protein
LRKPRTLPVAAYETSTPERIQVPVLAGPD